MKIYRFRYRKRILQGVLKEEFLFPVVGSVFGDFRLGTSPVPIADVRILPPVLPTKIIGIGRNYRDHAKELGNPLPEEPLVFLKPPTALIGHLDAVVMPPASARVDYEGEVGVVIRKKARSARRRRPGRRRTSSAIPASTTSPPGTSRPRTSSSPGPRASTPSPPSGPASRPGSTRPPSA